MLATFHCRSVSVTWLICQGTPWHSPASVATCLAPQPVGPLRCLRQRNPQGNVPAARQGTPRSAKQTMSGHSRWAWIFKLLDFSFSRMQFILFTRFDELLNVSKERTLTKVRCPQDRNHWSWAMFSKSQIWNPPMGCFACKTIIIVWMSLSVSPTSMGRVSSLAGWRSRASSCWPWQLLDVGMLN